MSKKKKKPGESTDRKDNKTPAQTTEPKKAEKAAPSGVGGKCVACEGKLVDLQDYTFHQALRRAAACIPTAVALCIAWSVVYGVGRVLIGGHISAAGAGGLALLVGHKVLVGVILGALLGAAAGLWRADVGLFIGVVIGSLGGFFVAAAPMMPLQSSAAHRLDVVLAAVVGGVLSGATVYIAWNRGTKKSQKRIGPEPHSQDSGN